MWQSIIQKVGFFLSKWLWWTCWNATGNGFFDPQRCFTLHISMPHYYSTSDWWVVVFLWFQSAYSGHKLSSLHIKKCSFHVTLFWINWCKNYTNNDVDSQATPKWYIKHDIITVLLLEALERQRNASVLLPLPHEKGHFVVFLHKESVDVLHWDLMGLVGTCQDLWGLVGSLSGLVGTCWDLLGLVGTCRDLLGLVRSCWEKSGKWILWNLTLRELQLWSIKFWPNSLSQCPCSWLLCGHT